MAFCEKAEMISKHWLLLQGQGHRTLTMAGPLALAKPGQSWLSSLKTIWILGHKLK